MGSVSPCRGKEQTHLTDAVILLNVPDEEVRAVGLLEFCNICEAGCVVDLRLEPILLLNRLGGASKSHESTQASMG